MRHGFLTMMAIVVSVSAHYEPNLHQITNHTTAAGSFFSDPAVESEVLHVKRARQSLEFIATTTKNALEMFDGTSTTYKRLQEDSVVQDQLNALALSIKTQLSQVLLQVGHSHDIKEDQQIEATGMLMVAFAGQLLKTPFLKNNFENERLYHIKNFVAQSLQHILDVFGGPTFMNKKLLEAPDIQDKFRVLSTEVESTVQKIRTSIVVMDTHTTASPSLQRRGKMRRGLNPILQALEYILFFIVNDILKICFI